MKIDIICNDGSPLGVTTRDIYGENGRVGIGGAELALLTMCEAWHNAGHEVRLYNNPNITNGSPFPQYPLSLFLASEPRDILVIFRSPNNRIAGATGKKIWWSCDQYTIGNFAEFSHLVDKIVTISPFHTNFFRSTYGIEGAINIDLPVRSWDYEQKIEKIPHRLIFCSVPDRGLGILARLYKRIQQKVNDVSLVITSDYRLWGVDYPANEAYIPQFMGMEGVRFLGAIPRRELVREQLQAQVQAYPCTYEELFCYAVAECQTAKVTPVTSEIGALSTTNNGVLVHGEIGSPEWDEVFIGAVVMELNNDHYVGADKDRFSVDRILKEWDEKVFNG
jgi:glycosyltransferase involved in cell wall biosynthesis